MLNDEKLVHFWDIIESLSTCMTMGVIKLEIN